MINRFLFLEVEIEGLNQIRLINFLRKNHIYIRNIQKKDKNLLIVEVDFKSRNKFFAFFKDSCYNIKSVKYKGYFSFIRSVIKRYGLILGFCFFLVALPIADLFIFKINIFGSGDIFQNEIMEYLEDKQIKEGQMFSKINRRELESELLENFENLSFVAIEKRGNILNINAEKCSDKPIIIDNKPCDLVSNESGKIKKILVFSGTSHLKISDEVKVSDVLIFGYYLLGDKKIDVKASGEIILECKKDFRIETDNEDYAIAIAKKLLGDEKFTNISTTKIKEENKDIIYCRIFYEKIIF